MAFLDRDFIACLKCSQDCFQWHAGNFMARPHIAPSFVTLLQDICLLRVPRHFSASFLGKCSGQVQLEGPAGKGWCAELRREKDLMTFANPGWSAFVENFKLQTGDSLLFTYLGRNIFKVRIFGLEGVEKGSQCQSIIPVVDECPSQAYNIRKEQIPLEIDKNILVYDDVGPYDDKKENKISNEAFGVSTFVSNSCSNGAFDEVDSEEQGNDEIMYTKCEDDYLISPCFGDYKEDLMSTEHKACQVLTSNYKVTMNERENLQEATMVETGGRLLKIESIGWEADQQAWVNSWNKRNLFSKRSTRGRPLEERPNISENVRQRLICAANAFKSPYPIARKSLKPSHDHKMILPKLFVEKFMPKRIASLTLTDPQGEDWPCKWLGATKAAGPFVPCISAGWSQFAHTHQLKTDDILVFELIEQQSLHFKVHFFKPQALDVLSQPPFLLSETPSL